MEGDQNNNSGMGGANPSPSPAPASAPTMATAQGGSSAGLIGAIVVIVALVIVGGLYFWSQRGSEKSILPTEDTTAGDQSINAINAQSTSDVPSTIESDLNSTNIDTLDAEINAS